MEYYVAQQVLHGTMCGPQVLHGTLCGPTGLTWNTMWFTGLTWNTVWSHRSYMEHCVAPHVLHGTLCSHNLIGSECIVTQQIGCRP